MSHHKIGLVWRFIPIIIVILVGMVFYFALQQPSNQLQLAQKGRPVPEFMLTDLLNPEKTFTQQLFTDQVVVLNIWASWCAACHTEFTFLHQLTKRSDILLYGLNYRDKAKPALAVLQRLGNPYQKIIADPDGKLALQLGVYGVPETYLIADGVIVYRYSGELTTQSWQQYIEPQLATLLDR